MTGPPGDDPAPAPPVTGAPVVVAPMRRRHLRAVLRIEAQQEHEGWSLGLFLSEIGRRHDRTYLVARQAGQVRGYLGLLYALEDAHVTTLAVDEGHRRRQLATRLLLVGARRALVHGARNLTLEVRASNEAAIAVYRRFGFAPVGVRPGYYGDVGEDALVMWATDIDGPAYAERLDGSEAGLPTATRTEELGA